MDTLGAWPFAEMFQVRSSVSSEALPAVSWASDWACQVPSVGTVISFDHVVLVALGTSGVMRIVLYVGSEVPSSWR